MRDLDLTKRFRRYRDAVRLIWNVFLEGYSDQEDQYREIEPGLFRGVMESNLDRNLLPSKGPRGDFYPDLIVKYPSRYAYFLDETILPNEWPRCPLPKKLTLHYSELFDFAWETGNSRDFEFIQCLGSIDDDPQNGPIVLVQAKTARVVLRPRNFAVSLTYDVKTRRVNETQ